MDAYDVVYSGSLERQGLCPTLTTYQGVSTLGPITAPRAARTFQRGEHRASFATTFTPARASEAGKKSVQVRRERKRAKEFTRLGRFLWE